MKKATFGYIVFTIWLFSSIFFIGINIKLHLNIPPRDITFPIWFPIVTFVGTDLTVYLLTYLKDYFSNK